MANVIRFKFTNVPRQEGEQARFKVVQGPDFGALYVLVANQATIGRGEDNDLVISDLKASRNHALIMHSPFGWVVKDKGSSNGIVYNGKVTREATLKLGDTIVVGGTTLEFVTAEVGTQMLMAPVRDIGRIQEEQRYLKERRDKLRDGFKNIFSKGESAVSGQGGPQPAGSSGLLKNPLVLLILGSGVVFLLFSGDEKGIDQLNKVKKSSLDQRKDQDLASYLPAAPLDRSVETLFKDGMREYFLGNFTRAKNQFETVLQVNPSHVLANIYLENSNGAIKEEIKLSLENGKKGLQSGKLRESRGHFERVLRLLYRDQTNPAYIEAKEQLEKVMKEINGDKGATS